MALVANRNLCLVSITLIRRTDTTLVFLCREDIKVGTSLQHEVRAGPHTKDVGVVLEACKKKTLKGGAAEGGE